MYFSQGSLKTPPANPGDLRWRAEIRKYLPLSHPKLCKIVAFTGLALLQEPPLHKQYSLRPEDDCTWVDMRMAPSVLHHPCGSEGNSLIKEGRWPPSTFININWGYRPCGLIKAISGRPGLRTYWRHWTEARGQLPHLDPMKMKTPNSLVVMVSIDLSSNWPLRVSRDQ